MFKLLIQTLYIGVGDVTVHTVVTGFYTVEAADRAYARLIAERSVDVVRTRVVKLY